MEQESVRFRAAFGFLSEQIKLFSHLEKQTEWRWKAGWDSSLVIFKEDKAWIAFWLCRE